MRKITVDLKERAYPLLISSSNQFTETLSDYIKGDQVLIVSNTTVAPLYMEFIEAQLQNFDVSTLVLEDGEIFKNFDSLQKIITKLLTLKYTRSSTLIALGGGVIGDVSGFAASVYQRGINFIQIPTSLLAQVDSSIGGKTAINHPLGKNMVGSFYQPKAVFINVDTLDTLARREFVSGLAEVIKYGLIRDRAFYNWLLSEREKILLRDKETIKELIYQSCENKRQIVIEDEFENGDRALLNLGHTFGHAIEKNMGYSGILHGEAVSVGIVMAAYVSMKMKFLNKQQFDGINEVLESFSLPIRLKVKFSFEQMLDAMFLDKKNISKQIRFVLLEDIGKGVIVDSVPDQFIEEAFQFCIEQTIS